jgi:hypothetical protein
VIVIGKGGREVYEAYDSLPYVYGGELLQIRFPRIGDSPIVGIVAGSPCNSVYDGPSTIAFIEKVAALLGIPEILRAITLVPTLVAYVEESDVVPLRFVTLNTTGLTNRPLFIEPAATLLSVVSVGVSAIGARVYDRSGEL